MRRSHSPFLLVWAALSLLVAAACAPTADSGSAAGILQISVSGGESDLIAASLSYRLTLRGSGGELATYTLEPPAVSCTLALGSGVWAVRAAGYTSAGAFYAAGDAVALVAAGAAGAVTIPIPVAAPLLVTLEAVAAWIAEAGAINPEADGRLEAPIPLWLALDLADPGGGWEGLLDVIEAGGKYVALDLAACTMDGAEFDPGEADAGEGYVVSLALPDGATSVKADIVSGAPVFRYFTALTSLSGAGILIVGDAAFQDCTALTTVSLPKAEPIGGAFWYCTALTSLDLSSAVTIRTPASRTGYDGAWEAKIKAAFGPSATITLVYTIY